jgi:hypothetical protein
MVLNPEKTQCLRIGSYKNVYNYSLNNQSIEWVDSVKDIGVTIQSDLKFTIHCSSVIRKAYFTIRNIFSTFKGHDHTFYCKLYTCYVRPLLEYASQVWSPVLKQNIDKIERVQRYYTRRILYPNNLSYWDRLSYLKLESLEERRIKSDLVLFYKMISSVISIDINGSFQFVMTQRGHNRKLYVNYCRTDKRKMYWVIRITRNWNDLSNIIVNSSSVNVFKRKIKTVNFIGRGSIYVP